MSDVWTVVSAISASLSALVVVAAAVYGALQVSELKKARGLQSLLAVHAQYRSSEVKLIRRRLLAGELGDVTKLSDTDQEQLANLLGQVELIAVLVDRGLLDEDLVHAMFQSIPDIVDQAKPYIKLRRQSHAGYADLSEKLATKMVAAYTQRHGSVSG
jgi:Domain of unknown function (DUF4760)